MVVNICPEKLRRQWHKKLRRASKRRLLDISSYDSDVQSLPSRTADLPVSPNSSPIPTTSGALRASPSWNGDEYHQAHASATSPDGSQEVDAGRAVDSVQSCVTCPSCLEGAVDVAQAEPRDNTLPEISDPDKCISTSSDYGSSEEGKPANDDTEADLRRLIGSHSKSLRLRTMEIPQQLRSGSPSSTSCVSSQPREENEKMPSPILYETPSTSNLFVTNYTPLDHYKYFGDASGDSPKISPLASPTLSTLSAPREGPATRSVQSPKSVHANYDAAASVWEKAIGDYSDQLARRKSSVSARAGQSALSATKQRLKSIVTGDEELDPREQRPLQRIRTGSIFKPLETEHTFDRLAVPGKPLLSRSQPLLKEKKDVEKLHAERQLARSNSSPGPGHTTHLHDPGDFFPQLPAGYSLAQRKKSVIHAADESSKSFRRRRSSQDFELDIGAWARYPSHTRTQRSLSAGLADGVYVRDFAPLQRAPSSSSSDSELSPSNSMTSSKKRKIKKKRQAKTRALAKLKVWHKRMGEVWKPWLSGSRKREKGHRSSVATSGLVKYPELELIAGSSGVEGK